MKRKVGRPRNQWKTSKIAIPQPILAQVNELVAKFKREQVGKLVKHSGCVEHMNPNSGEWAATITPMWNRTGIYRIKSKSEREMFIDKSVWLMTSEAERTMEQMFGAQFDAGARYKDLTQHFGENI